MKKGNKKLFLDRQKLYQLVVLRNSGWTINALAVHFNCDKTSVRAQLDKYGVNPETTFWFRDFVKPIMKDRESDDHRWRTLSTGERINRGKSYAEYMKEGK